MKRIALTLAVFVTAPPLTAHPHIFVDTGFDLYFDADGALSQVKVTWSYDAFYSLLITQDMGLDLDGDGLMTEAEKTALQGFDMQWDAGFNGDLEISLGNMPVPLSAPRDYTAVFVLGRITTSHLRDIEALKMTFETLHLRPFDLTYYTSYDVTYPVTLHGIDSCEVHVQEPQQTAALTALQEQLSGLGADTDPADVGLSGIGAVLATSVNVSCSGS